MAILTAALGLGTALVSGVSGWLQRSRAAQLERENPRPIATVDEGILENRAIASRMAGRGLPDQVYSNALRGIQSNQAGALRTLRGSGRGANVASITRQGNIAQGELDAQDALARDRNLSILMDANTQLAGERERVWNWNEAGAYQELSGRIAELRGAGNQNIMAGLGMLTQLGASGAFEPLNSLFKRPDVPQWNDPSKNFRPPHVSVPSNNAQFLD